MENISRGPTFGDFVIIRTKSSRQDVTVARLQSLSVDSQNIPCATLKRRGSWIISIYMYLCTYLFYGVDGFLYYVYFIVYICY
jgi:hypothetical protein